MIANIRALPRLSAPQPQVERWTVGAVVISRLYLSSNEPAFTLRIPSPDLGVLLQVAGRSTLEHEGLTYRFPAGQWTALNAEHVHVQPQARDTQLLMLQIPRQFLSEDMARGTKPEHQPRAHNNRALSRTLRVFSARPHRFDGAMAEQISTLLCGVVEHAIWEQRYADRRDHRAAFSVYAKRLGRAYRYIRRHVDQPKLALGDIAKDAACTIRYLQKMFAPGGESVREFILRLRLELAHCDLLSARLSSQPVTEIALAHGFNNASHFTRKYRSYFGITPSAVRFAHQTVRLQYPDWHA